MLKPIAFHYYWDMSEKSGPATGRPRFDDLDTMTFGDMLIAALREAVAHERGELTEGVTVTARISTRGVRRGSNRQSTQEER